MLKAVTILSHIIAGIMIFTVIWVFWMIFTREDSSQWEGAALSPDGMIAAQIMEYGSYAGRHEVYMRNTEGVFRFSKRVAELNEAKLNQCAAGVRIVWRTSSDLEIHYLQAGWTEVPDPKVRVGGRWVTVTLVPYSGDSGIL